MPETILVSQRSHFDRYLKSLGATRQQQAKRLGISPRSIQRLLAKPLKRPPEYYQALAELAKDSQN